MIEDYKQKQQHEIEMWTRYEVPHDMINMARRRLRGLFHFSNISTATLERLVQSAYLQGVIDGYETAKQKDGE